MTSSTFLFFVGTCIALFVIFPYLRGGWSLDAGEKPKRTKRKRRAIHIERLMDGGTNEIAEGWKHDLHLDDYDDSARRR